MTTKDEPIPSDQFARVIEELRRLSVVVDEMQRGIETSRGQHAAEARRCFSRATDRLQESGYWLGQALIHARKAGH